MKCFKQYITEVERYEMENPNASNLDPLINAFNLVNTWGQVQHHIVNAPGYVDAYNEFMGELVPQLAVLPLYARAPIDAFDMNDVIQHMEQDMPPNEPGWYYQDGDWYFAPRPDWDDRPGAWVWDRFRWRNILTREVYPPE